MKSGIYRIKNVYTKRFYVGSSVNMEKRLGEHRRTLRLGTHHSRFLQREWDKYGEAAFSFDMLEFHERDVGILREHEQWWIDNCSNLLNCSKNASHPEHTPEVIAKISQKCKEAWACPERRAKQSARYKGVRPKVDQSQFSTDAHRAKLRETHRAKHRNYQAFGKLWSIKELAEEYGVKYTRLKDRIRAGWDVERAVMEPRGVTGPQSV